VTADARADSLTASDSTADDQVAHEARAAAIRQAMPQWAQLSSGFKPPAAATNPSLPTLVGLFILILCFFVVLTSISLKDQRREHSVMASLERTFSGEGMATPLPVPADAQTKRMLGDLLAKLGADVPLVSGVTSQDGDVLVLDLPRSLVFAGSGTDAAPGLGQILARVSQALKAGPSDFAYEIEIGLTEPALDEKAVAEGNAVAGALRAAGFANNAAMVSLIPGPAEAIALTIRLRPDARLDQGGNP
jgi:hypothetical protein